MTTHFIVWQYNESTAARRLHNDGQEFWINRTECGVPAGLGDAYVIVTLLPF